MQAVDGNITSSMGYIWVKTNLLSGIVKLRYLPKDFMSSGLANLQIKLQKIRHD